MRELAPISRPPEANSSFRRGQLLVLLSMFNAPLTVDRVGYLEFFAASPHLVVQDAHEAVRLQLVGFNPAALSYRSAPERFANRRSRVRSDLAALTAWGFASPRTEEGRIVVALTDLGRTRANELTSLYADAYRASIEIIRPLFRLSDAALGRAASKWLSGADRHIDVLDVGLDAQLTLGLGTDAAPSESS